MSVAERAAARTMRGQAMAEALMTLTVTPYAPKPDGGTEKDDDGYDVPAFDQQEPHAAKVQAASGDDSSKRYVQIAGVDRPVIEGGLHIALSDPVPVASEQRGKGWEYEVTGLGPVDDPALLGKRYLVVWVPVKSYATARRLDVVEL